MKILGDVISPFVRMTLVTAHEVGLAGRLALEKTPAKMAEANAGLVKFSPIGKIPVLVTDHDHAIHDSRVIMEYLSHVAGKSDFLPDDGVKRFRVLTLQATAIGAAEAAVALRYEQTQRPESMRWPEYMARLAQRIADAVDDLESHWIEVLAEAHVGSVATACMLSYLDFRHGSLDWRQGRPRLSAFHETFSARPSMLAWPLA